MQQRNFPFRFAAPGEYDTLQWFSEEWLADASGFRQEGGKGKIMKNRIKCVALSAFVLPGLGQLCHGRRLKGGLMILIDNVFILAALFVALRSAGKLMAGRVGALNTEQVLAGIQADAPYARWMLGGFMLLWVYGVVDAAFDKGEQ